MQQPSSQPSQDISAIMRQLERLDERTRDLATRQDLESLRKEVVARDLLEPQLSLLKVQIARLETDRQNDQKEIDQRFEEMKNEQTSRSERLWMRLGPVVGAIALILSLIEFLSHVRFAP